MELHFSGCDEFIALMEDALITEAEEKAALKKAGKVVKEKIQANTTQKTGKAKKSIRQKSTPEGEEIYSKNVGALMEEWGTSFASHNIGFFENATLEAEGEVLNIIEKELIKKI